MAGQQLVGTLVVPQQGADRTSFYSASLNWKLDVYVLTAILLIVFNLIVARSFFFFFFSVLL